MRDVSKLARISVSSHKEEHPPQRLVDGDLNTYWQSDGAQPHYITLEFPQRMTLTKLSLYLDHAKDESYTPNLVSIRAGNSNYDLQDLNRFEIGEGQGWIDFSLGDDDDNSTPLRVHVLQICILANLQNGKDTHIRQLKVFAPPARHDMLPDDVLPFSNREYQMYSTFR
ncbi:anaphase promoting complex subunit 10-like protein [Phlyctochytrium arcticum]|nr:anaphase promoting complex subunit 10-like protein [Phlyctochytrium arcticum]